MPPSKVRRGCQPLVLYILTHAKGPLSKGLTTQSVLNSGQLGLRGASQKNRGQEHDLCPARGERWALAVLKCLGREKEPEQTGLQWARVSPVQTPCGSIP